MAAALFPSQDTANQVGGSFVTQYYNVLHQDPEQVYQFYKDESTMTRIDGNTTETATGIIEIHSVISSVKFSSIEIKTANFLKSLMGGVMVMVSGLVQAGQYEKRRKFIQSFFLATQESGYFVLNDFFHYVDEEYFCTPALLAQGNYSVPQPDAVCGYSLDGATGNGNGNGNGDSSYDYKNKKSLIEETTLSSSFLNMSLFVDGPVAEPIRLTYASILKSGVVDAGENVNQSPFPSPVISETHTPPSDIFLQFEDEVESKSVFVKNVSRYFTEADLENEFIKFGRLTPHGVAIRSHKDTGKYYAFIEYEDTQGVQNALKASPVDINGWLVYVEERRRSNNNNNNASTASRGRERGRGGRFGGRGRGSRSRVNGFEEEHPNPQSTRTVHYQHP